jgi:UDP-N-acetyl-D-mannosaminuronic acid dehydrogenase
LETTFIYHIIFDERSYHVLYKFNLSIADRISKEAKNDGALVSIESTISRGTSEKVFGILRHRLHVVHAPHRWYALEEK